MAFTPIDPLTIQVGDPITSDTLNLVKTNFDDHESRLNSIEGTGGVVYIFNGDISFAGYSTSQSDVFYYKATSNFSINDFRVQLFSKDGISSGSLIIDLQKSINTNDINFNTVLSTTINFNFATDADYSEQTASINSSLSSITSGQVLRVKIISLPSGFFGKILLAIGAQ